MVVVVVLWGGGGGVGRRDCKQGDLSPGFYGVEQNRCFKFLSCMFRLLRFRTALKVQEISALNSAKLTTAAYLMDENLSGCHIYQVRELILIE